MQTLITLALAPLLVFTAPKYQTKYVSKPNKILQYRGGASYNFLPEEDQMPTWNNPWIYNGGLMASAQVPLPPPPHDTFLMNNNPVYEVDPRMKSGGQKDLDDEDSQTMGKRSYMKMFRLFKKSFEDEMSSDNKRNSVPMMG